MKNNNFIKNKKIPVSLLSNLRVIISGLSLLSIVAYLLVVNHTNTMGIEIGEMQVRIAELKDESRDMENMATQLQSMQRIQALSTSELSMVQADNYQYLAGQKSGLAVRE